MTKRRIVFYPFYFFFNQNNYFLLNTFIVGFDSFFEIIGAIFVLKRIDLRNGLVLLHFGRDFGTIHHYFSMKNLLVDTFIKVVGYCSYKHTLCEIADFRCRDKTIHLRRDRCGLIVAIDGHRLPLLEHLTETLAEGLSGFTDHLPTEHIANSVLYHLAFLVSIIARKLREVLKAQTYRHLVASGSSNKVVQSTEVDSR